MINPRKLCRACRENSGKYPGVVGFTCTKRPLKKLCSQIDLVHLKNLNLDSGDIIHFKALLDYKQRILDNKLAIESKFSCGNILVPTNEAQFIETVKEIHSLLFKDSGVNFAGRTREIGELAYVDVNTNQFEGFLSKDINEGLRDLWRCILNPFLHSFAVTRPNRGELAQLGADFFSYFFRIHPFVDGNGRTARLFFQLILQKYNYIFKIRSDRKSMRRYIKSLRYSHRCHFKKGLEYHKSLDRKWMNTYLVQFLVRFILDNSLGEELEEVPG